MPFRERRKKLYFSLQFHIIDQLVGQKQPCQILDPSSAMPKIVDKAAKRDDILKAALKVFARKGYNYTKMIDIAREADIGKGTIYEYFRSKEDILLTAYNQYVQRSRRVVDDILAGSVSPLEKIRQIILQTISIYAQDPSVMRVFFDFWIESTHNDSVTDMDFKKLYADYRSLAKRLLDEAQAAGQIRRDIGKHVSSILIAVVEGTFLQWIIDPEAFDLSEMAEDIVDTLIRGLAAPNGGAA